MKLLRMLFLCFLFTGVFTASPARAQGIGLGCSSGDPLGLFTDFCYDSMFPIRMMGTMDVPFVNDVSPPPLAATYDFPPGGCYCTEYFFGIPFEVPGYLQGAWVPIQVVEATRAPGCVVMLAGLSFAPALASLARYGGQNHSADGTSSNGFRHFTMYDFPLSSVFAGILGFDSCAATGPSYESAISSLLLPFWDRADLANFMFPEAIPLANPLAIFSGAVACAADTTGIGAGFDDAMFWSMGCWGRTYPLTGSVGTQGTVTTSSLIAARAMYTMGALSRYAGNIISKYGVTTVGNLVANDSCTPLPTPFLLKSQFKMAQIFPVPESGIGVASVASVSSGAAANASPLGMLLSRCAHRIGASEYLWGPYRKAMITGEDQAYLVWRWVDCCEM